MNEKWNFGKNRGVLRKGSWLVFIFILHSSFFTVILSQPAKNKTFKKEKSTPSKDGRMSKDEYIRKYKEDAIKDMLRTKVPASITLGQAMLESDNGNSKLAVNANNHFGIKCHNGWTGATYNMDDDAKNECFRKYKTVLDSYNDHSDFLHGRNHYAFLFELKSTDYKGWAEGLKKAGYATSPTYAKDLIKIIEDNKLYEMDVLLKVPEKESEAIAVETPKKAEEHKAEVIPAPVKNPKPIVKPQNPPEKKNNPPAKAKPINTPPPTPKKEISISVLKQPLLINNVKYVVATKGDTYFKIAKQYDMNVGQLYRYNELPKDAALNPGQIVFLQPKRRSGCEEYHLVKEGETMYGISQQFGMKLKLLYKKNRMQVGTEPSVGQKLWLRSTKPKV